MLTVTILSESGQVVRRLVEDEPESAGRHTATWDRRDARGRRMPAGTYVVQVDAVAPDARAGVSAAARAS